MTFSYDEADDFDETDDLDEIDDLDEEPQEAFLEEDDDDPGTALSQAFRQAATGTMMDEDDADEDEDDIEESDAEEDDIEGDAEEDGIEGDAEEDDIEDDAEEDGIEDDAEEDGIEGDAEEDGIEEDDDADANAYEQRLVEPVDALPDENENELEVELPPLELAPTEMEVEPFRPKEQSNSAYRDARTAYHEEKNYQRAIEKFNEAIEYEVRSIEDSLTDANEIVAKSKYWQAEAYVKLQDLPQAIGTFEDLVKTCQGHYLSVAAQRRADQLNAKNS